MHVCVCACVSLKHTGSLLKSPGTFLLSTLTATLRPSVFHGKLSNKQLYSLFSYINMLLLLLYIIRSFKTNKAFINIFILFVSVFYFPKRSKQAIFFMHIAVFHMQKCFTKVNIQLKKLELKSMQNKRKVQEI